VILSKLKIGLIALAGAVLAALLVAVKILTRQNSKLRARVEHAEARVHRARIIADKDNELESQTESHRAKIKNEIETTGSSSALDNLDRLWDDETTS